jgi:flagellar M-ring protein FliF
MLEQLRAAWDNLEPRQRTALAIALASTVIGLGVVGIWSSRPDYATLYSGLAQEDAADVVEELRGEKVPYRLSAGGSSILVPTTALHETRLKMAGKGMPRSSNVGFEVFDRSGLPGTDFSNNVNLQRALQGELERTIASLEQIDSARVHLSMPRETLYGEQARPTASVLLELKTNADIERSQVRGIAYLVSSAVDDLDLNNVTVVDTSGRVLHGGNDEGLALSETTLDTAKAHSDALTRRLQTMLDGMFGPRMTIVRAQADLDLDSEETSEEKVEPLGDTRDQAIVREHSSQERYTGGDAVVGGAGGIPSALAGSAAGGANEGAGNYLSSEETREYQFSKTTRHRKRSPGRITRLNVAAVVDESLPVTAIERARDVLTAAAGIDIERGDTIVVQRLKLKSAELAAQDAKEMAGEQTARKRQETLALLMRHGLPALMALVLVAVAIRSTGELRRSMSSTDSEMESEGYAAQDSMQPIVFRAAAEGPSDREQPEQSPAVVPLREDQRLAEEIQRMARERPDALADELRRMVAGGDGG